MRNKEKYGCLYLFPTTLGSRETEHVLPPANLDRMSSVQHFIVENIRSARRFLRNAGYTGSLDEEVYPERTHH